LVKIVTTRNPRENDGFEWPLIILRIADILFAPGRLGERSIGLTLNDWQREMMGASFDYPVTASATTGAAAYEPFRIGKLPLPYPSSWWLVGASRVGIDTVVFDPDAGHFDFAAGETTIDYPGNNIDVGGVGLSMTGFIEEMTNAEMDGRFVLRVNVDNQLPQYKWYSRSTIADRYAVATIVDVGSNLFTEGSIITYGDQLCNRLDLTVYPRKTGTAGSVLYTLETPMAIPGLDSRTITARFRDANDPSATCSAIVLSAPVPVTDYTGNLAEDGSGEDYTYNLTIAIENQTNSAEVVISNSALGQVYLTFLQLKGTPYTASQPLTITVTDAESIYRYGLRTHSKTIAATNDITEAEDYANAYVYSRSTPIAEYRFLERDFPLDDSSPLFLPAFEQDTVGIRLTDPWTSDAVTEPLWIGGAQHAVDVSKGEWKTLWYVEKYILSTGWVLGDSELGILGLTTAPGF
jgi:hypothetical protein